MDTTLNQITGTTSSLMIYPRCFNREKIELKAKGGL